MTVTATGFATAKRENVVLQVSSPATVNLALQVQGGSVVIDVSGEAPMVNTQDATLGNNFNSRQLTDLPSEGRDPASILSLQPGVVYIGKATNTQQDNDSRGGAVGRAGRFPSGPYVLRVVRNSQDPATDMTDQTIWLSPGWQTVVFIPNGPAGPDARGVARHRGCRAKKDRARPARRGAGQARRDGPHAG